MSLSILTTHNESSLHISYNCTHIVQLYIVCTLLLLYSVYVISLCPCQLQVNNIHNPQSNAILPPQQYIVMRSLVLAAFPNLHKPMQPVFQLLRLCALTAWPLSVPHIGVLSRCPFWRCASTLLSHIARGVSLVILIDIAKVRPFGKMWKI